MHPTAPLLHFENVGVRMAAARELLSDIDLALRPGELVVVVGRRGTGKSLLLRLAAGDRHPDRGRLCLLGQEIREGGRDRARLRRRIGWCADRPELLPGLSPVQNVAVPLRMAGIGSAEARADAAELLDWLGGGAEPLRIGVARALIARPPLVALDEPLRDAGGVPADRLAALIGEMRRTGAAFLVTVDDLERGAALEPDRRLLLAAGRLVAT